MYEYEKVIQEISSLDLSKYPYNEVKKLLIDLQKFGVILTTLHKGKKIIRARLNNKGETHDNISKLSYKPQKFNTTYQRASTPKNTMFYGSIVPEGIEISENQTERITVFGELAHSDSFLSDNQSIGEKKITFARFDVEEDVHLVSIIHHKKFPRTPKIITELQKEYEEVFRDEELKKRSLAISEFLGDIYAKENINVDYDYMVSGIFSELACERYDGVLYPSVRLAGDGMNVAIKPESMSKLKFISSSECTIYKNKMQIVIGTDTRSVIGREGHLTYNLDQNISPEYLRKRVGLI